MPVTFVWGGAVLLAGASLLAAPAPQRGEIQSRVTVLVYDYGALPAQTLTLAEEEAGSVFRHAGIEVAWLDCRRDTSRCDGYTSSTPILRLQRRFSKAANLLDARAMGFSIGNLAAISLERAELLARSAPARLPEILGSVIAHEIGHVLIPDKSHSGSGIMRARWHLDDWNRMSQGTFWFTAEQARSLRRELDTRVQTASSAKPATQPR